MNSKMIKWVAGIIHENSCVANYKKVAPIWCRSPAAADEAFIFKAPTSHLDENRSTVPFRYNSDQKYQSVFGDCCNVLTPWKMEEKWAKQRVLSNWKRKKKEER